MGRKALIQQWILMMEKKQLLFAASVADKMQFLAMILFWITC